MLHRYTKITKKRTNTDKAYEKIASYNTRKKEFNYACIIEYVSKWEQWKIHLLFSASALKNKK